MWWHFPKLLVFLSAYIHFISALTAEEQAALLAIGYQWKEPLGWKGPPSCNWKGLMCEEDHVILLDLAGKDLSGTLPVAVKDLSHLNSILIQENHLSGTLPPEWGSLQRLQTFHVANNHIRGTIPQNYSRLQSLQVLYLQQNKFTGPIPSELASLPNLTYVNLQGNKLTGEVPTFTSALKSLYLSQNSLTGTIGNWICDLKFVDLRENWFACPLPNCCDYHESPKSKVHCTPCQSKPSPVPSSLPPLPSSSPSPSPSPVMGPLSCTEDEEQCTVCETCCNNFWAEKCHYCVAWYCQATLLPSPSPVPTHFFIPNPSPSPTLSKTESNSPSPSRPPYPDEEGEDTSLGGNTSSTDEDPHIPLTALIAPIVFVILTFFLGAFVWKQFYARPPQNIDLPLLSLLEEEDDDSLLGEDNNHL
jgi:hypothetical protein